MLAAVFALGGGVLGGGVLGGNRMLRRRCTHLGVGHLGHGTRLARGHRVGSSIDCFAGFDSGGFDLADDVGAGLWGESVCGNHVGSQFFARGRVVDPVDPLTGNAHREDQCERNRHDADTGGGTSTEALPEEQDDQERRRHERRDDPDLVEEIGDHSISPSSDRRR